MKLKKRTKASRIRGARTCGWGFRQKHKGHGNKGGFGMAGTGKRADHKKQGALTMAKKAGAESYFGSKGFTSRGTARKKTNVMNLSDIQKNFSGSKIELKKYKILGDGEGFKATIEAKSATQSAIDKMEKAGGKIILPVVKEAVKQHIKKEKKVEKKEVVDKKESVKGVVVEKKAIKKIKE